MVARCRTVARGWSKVVGKSRDAKDVEPMAPGNAEVRSAGERKDGIHAFTLALGGYAGRAFNRVSLHSCVRGSAWASLASFLSSCLPSPRALVPLICIFVVGDFLPTCTAILESLN